MTDASTIMRQLRPSRYEVIDGAFLLALAITALAGFQSAFGGWTFLAVGVIGAAIGLVRRPCDVETRRTPDREPHRGYRGADPVRLCSRDA